MNQTQPTPPPAPPRPASSRLFPWYDSYWLNDYEHARALLRARRPELLESFEAGLKVFRTPPGFQPVRLANVFDDATLTEIRGIMATLRPQDLELQEARRFGRFIVHNVPRFTELQHGLVDLVSRAVGEPVEPSYNFLSLYGHMGQCPVHLDSPEAKYTLDLCLGQSQPWPIYFSEVIAWPEAGGVPWPGDGWEEKIKCASGLRFTPHTLQPSEAVIFSGSSQWHYRDALPQADGRQFCDLLFFHFVPRGSAELVKPRNWARLFEAPELAEVIHAEQ